MLKFNNTHIFTKYLKQLLSSFDLPTCKIYTKEFAKYLDKHGIEDPRVLESFDVIKYQRDDSSKTYTRLASRTSYLKNDELCYYFWDYSQNSLRQKRKKVSWKYSNIFYDCDSKNRYGLVRTLNSPGNYYDSNTHEYLGDYLRFVRDYYDINLMSLYNCFNNKIYSNIRFDNSAAEDAKIKIIFDSQDPKYNIYAFPVKLFSNYTIAIDCDQGIELFCGLYKTSLYDSSKAEDLILKTYQKKSKTIFSQPFLYDKLDVKNWKLDLEAELEAAGANDNGNLLLTNKDVITRYDIANHEKDLKLFIKVPVNCKSSITVLEGDFRGYNDFKFSPQTVTTILGNRENQRTELVYEQNSTVINFDKTIDFNEADFNLISKLQLLALNTGESYPFADRLIEYLSNSAITPIDKISDNIKRVQKVLKRNQHHFKTEGVWESKIQKIIYDYVMNSGNIRAVKESDLSSTSDLSGVYIARDYKKRRYASAYVSTGDLDDKSSYHKCRTTITLKRKRGSDSSVYRLVDFRHGYHLRLGHTSKSSLYDVLGYVDRNAEKWYANWALKNKIIWENKEKVEAKEATVSENIQNVDIYNGLYDI